MLKNKVCMMMVSPYFWQIFPRGCSAQCPVDRSWCAQRCCDGAATELRRSCDGVAAATELRRPAPSRSFCRAQLRRAHSARQNEASMSIHFPPRVEISMVVAHSPRPPPMAP